MYQRIHRSTSWNSSTQRKSSQLFRHSSIVESQQDSHRPPRWEEIENEAFDQNKSEGLGLQLKIEKEIITPIEQERASQFAHNFTDIPVHTPGRQISAPVQPKFVVGLNGMEDQQKSTQQLSEPPSHRALNLGYLAPSIQAKLSIGQPGDQYKQKADRITGSVVQQLHAPKVRRSHSQQGTQRESMSEEHEAELESAITRAGVRGDFSDVQNVRAWATLQLATEISSIIVDDSIKDLSPGQVRKSEFLNQLYQALRNTGTKEYEGTNLTVEGCPYIEYWFEHYRGKEVNHIERALRKYSGAASNVHNAEELIQLVTLRATKGFRKQAESGDISELPEDIPKQVGIGKIPDPSLIVQAKLDGTKFMAKAVEAINSPAKLDSQAYSQQVIQRGCLKGLCDKSPTGNYQELQVVSQLPDWNGAKVVGYHATKHWDAIQESGEFRPGGGVLGNGIYVAPEIELARFYKGTGVILEVGYIGNQTEWVAKNLTKKSQYNQSEDGQYDVVDLDAGPISQRCYKLDGPKQIQQNNFRVRLYEN